MTDIAEFECMFAEISCHVKVDLEKSPYYGTVPSDRFVDILSDYSTIDDPVSIEIAKQLCEQIPNNDKRDKASVALAFVQQNIKYSTDEERFGVKDVWETPIYVLKERVADCDGMANLYVSIAHNMGLDVISVIIKGHMFPAVSIFGSSGNKFRYNGKTYYHVETTGFIPAIGKYDEWEKELHMAAPKIPGDKYKSLLYEY